MITTSHTLLELNKNEREKLDLICDLYTQAKHFGFKLIAKDNYLLFSSKSKDKEIITTLSSDSKKILATKFNLTGRHVNSINIDLGMIISIYIEQRNNNLSDLQYSLAQINKSISKYNKANLKIETKYFIITKSKSYIQKQAYAYQQFIIKNKDRHKCENKNNLENKLKFIFNYKEFNLPNFIKVKQIKELLVKEHIDTKLLAATQKYGKNLYQLKLLQNKQKRLSNKITKIENDIAQGKLRICFGTKKLFKQQSITENVNRSNYNPQSILFKDHIDWLTSWYDSRSHQFLLTGAGEEISGNQNCQATINHKGLFNLKLRIPDGLISKELNNGNLTNRKNNKYLTIKDIDFGKNNSLLQSSLLSEVKEVRILTIAEKAEIKQLKNDLFELKKHKFEVIKAHNLSKKAIANLNVDNFNNEIGVIDKEIFKLQELIKLKSDIFSLTDDNKETIRTRHKKIAIPITYRFVKNIDRASPKYGKWSVHFTVEVIEPEIITDISLGAIGVDLNANHLAVSEVDGKGNLIQSFNIHLNPETHKEINNGELFNLINSNNGLLEQLPIIQNNFKLNQKSITYLSAVSSDKTQNILGNALKIITDLSLRTGKPIIIEKLDFTQKKRQLAESNKYNKVSNREFNYNHMISSFAYSKFKELLKAQATKNGCEVIEINPAYSSLIGAINYVKPLGLSVHMAASYVIARRGLNHSNKKLTKNYTIDEQPRIIKIDNKNKLEIYTKSKVYLVDYIVNSNLSEDKSNKDKTLYNEWSAISNLYKTLQKYIYKENLQKQKLTKELKSIMKSSNALSNELDLSYLFSEDYLPEHDTQ